MRTILFVAMMMLSTSAWTFDSVSLEVGQGNDSVQLVRLGAQWYRDKPIYSFEKWNVIGYIDVSYGVWESGDRRIGDIGLTPTFRLQQKYPSTYAPYVEGAIGFHYLTNRDIAPGRTFSTNFQYGDHIGAGIRLGDHRQYDLSMRVQHLSNGDLKKPNPGINFVQLRFQYHL